MNNKDYLSNLLSLCTEKQTDLFNKMYPNGVDSKKQKWAITQLEYTLKNLNSTNEEFKLLKKEHETSVKEFTTELSLLTNKINSIETELKQAYSKIERLSNPITTESNDITERLELLAALEAGGVDNWDGYDFSIENYQNMS